MTPRNFELALRTFSKQKPFKTFTIEFLSGSRIEVIHPEVVSMHKSMFLYRAPTGVYSLFDCFSVARFIGSKDLPEKEKEE